MLVAAITTTLMSATNDLADAIVVVDLIEQLALLTSLPPIIARLPVD